MEVAVLHKDRGWESLFPLRCQPGTSRGLRERRCSSPETSTFWSDEPLKHQLLLALLQTHYDFLNPLLAISWLCKYKYSWSLCSVTPWKPLILPATLSSQLFWLVCSHYWQYVTVGVNLPPSFGRTSLILPGWIRCSQSMSCQITFSNLQRRTCSTVVATVHAQGDKCKERWAIMKWHLGELHKTWL